MNFRDFILNKSPKDLEKYAKDAGTTVGYIKTHLLYGYKEPRKILRKALSTASNGEVSEIEVLQHFGLYPNQVGNNQNSNNSTCQ
ncbi:MULTISPECIES: hypothetical protein [Acinetobacter]|jgi:hypothetical protein|uniref:Uncharacterized protein n=1 Tax=Acinetobacter radioresistens TaxID=40216 RepID=A0A8H2K3Q2_ACIRA|nr:MULTISPECIES: hypothetical protein [Acinetobacter]KCX37092.1 hypothetical protein J577_1868 [Acinetobacter sp. 263903-1]TNX93916.1 hypothetical protein FHY67_00160 [Acinetobacter radioresistens]WGX73781.1 hypothetical protein QJS67_04085 [Acinetobacter radioresistens]